MAAAQLNIGFISPGPATWPHYDSFMALIPEFVTFDFQGLGLYGKSLYEITGKKAEVVSKISDLAIAKRWQAVIVIGAPMEVMNPGLFKLRLSIRRDLAAKNAKDANEIRNVGARFIAPSLARQSQFS